MTNDNDARRRFRQRTLPLSHKFPIGARVIQKFGAHTVLDSFRVTGHLPDGGSGLQYRIKRDRDGQERVATESALARVAQDNLIP
jgi:hypothetical protein